MCLYVYVNVYINGNDDNGGSSDPNRKKEILHDSKNNVKILKFVCTHIFFDNYMTYSFLKIPIILLQREG